MALPLENSVTNFTSFPVLFGAENVISNVVFSPGASTSFIRTGTVHPHDASTLSIFNSVFPELEMTISLVVKLPLATLPK